MLPTRFARSRPSRSSPRRTDEIVRTALVAFLATLYVASPLAAPAEEPIEVILELHPARIDHLAPQPRLFPADTVLEQGNAAVVLNMLYAERLGMVFGWPEDLHDVASLPVGDPRIAATRVTPMIPDMHRAGRIRDADWNHPLRGRPNDVYLGDMQLARRLCECGLTVWIKQQLAEGHSETAEEGIRTQLACARHIGSPPFLVTALQAHSVARHALDNVEFLVTRPDCANYRWSLSVLPPLFFDAPNTLAWEATYLVRSLPGLDHGPPPDDDAPAWRAIATEFFDLLDNTPKRLDDQQRADLVAKHAVPAREMLVHRGRVSAEQADAMAPETALMRMLLAYHDEIGRRRRTAWLRPPPEAIAELGDLDRLAAGMTEDFGLRGFSYASHVADYLFIRDFSRRAAILETVESLRHHAAVHEGRLPASLADLEYPSRPDPVALLPLDYARGEDPATATLSLPDVPGVPENLQRRRTYMIEMVMP